MGPVEYYFAFIGGLASWDWNAILFVLKILSVVISAGAVYLYVISVNKLSLLRVPKEVTIDDKHANMIQDIVAQPWVEIQQKLSSTNPADWSIAVIQADAILDKILKASGYIGDTMGDRLKQINSAELSAIDDIWRSHKIRNRLAHGTEGITRGEVDLAMSGYEKAFKELNYI